MKTQYMVILYNIIVVIAFAVLAYLFHKWWIVLFAIFCTQTFKVHYKGDDDGNSD